MVPLAWNYLANGILGDEYFETVRKRSALGPATIPEPRRLQADGSIRLVAESVAVADQPPDRVARLVRQHHDPVLVGGLTEQRGFLDHRIQRKIVEGGDPARIRRPWSHHQVAEERQRPSTVPGSAHDDRLMAGGMVELDTGNARYLIRFNQTIERQAGWSWGLFSAVRKLSS